MINTLMEVMRKAEQAAKQGDMKKAAKCFDIASRISLAIEQGITSEDAYGEYLVMCASGRLLD